MKQTRFFLLIICLLTAAPLTAASTSIRDTQNRLNQLKRQIEKLDSELKAKQKKTQLFTDELAQSEKKISQLAVKLQKTKDELAKAASALARQADKVKTLQQKEAAQQELLAQHLRNRYKIDTLQPLKSLLNQNQTADFSRKLIYYQYIIGSRKTVIKNLKLTKASLLAEQITYEIKLQHQQDIKKELTTEQKKLASERAWQARILEHLQADISENRNKLAQYQQNQQALTNLLKKLQAQSMSEFRLVFGKMRHKLPHPLKTRKFKKINGLNGISFPAREGEPVKAVYPGKVVFSDWLKGYGLLLILDHGQGYMTLYAHNFALLKETGAEVMQGEEIAKVGHSGGLRENGLYFEIRYRGKTIATADWLR